MAPNYGGACCSSGEASKPEPPPREVEARQWLPRRTGRAHHLVMLLALVGTMSVIGYGSAVRFPAAPSAGQVLSSTSRSRSKSESSARGDDDDGASASKGSKSSRAGADDDDASGARASGKSGGTKAGRVGSDASGRTSVGEESGEDPPPVDNPSDDVNEGAPTDDASSSPDVDSNGDSLSDEYTVTLMPTECSVKMASFCELHMRVASTSSSGLTISVAYRPEFNVSHAARIWSPTQHTRG